jgi:hypothetical protein
VKANVSAVKVTVSVVIVAVNGMSSKVTTQEAAFSGEKVAFHRDKARITIEDSTFSRVASEAAVHIAPLTLRNENQLAYFTPQP